MEISFTKVHGLGNDFVLIDELYGVKIPEEKKSDFSRRVCERKCSVGADGVLFLQSSENVDFLMRIFNSDGSEAETCLNGLRCLAFIYYKMWGRESLTIKTLAGKVKARVKPLSFRSADVELQILGRRRYKGKGTLKISNRELTYHSVDVGNPHAVIFLDDSIEKFPVEEIGHRIEYHPQFQPGRTNAEFVNVLRKNYLRMRVHERGACETQACASGAVATAIAGCKLGYCDKGEWVTIEQPGGKLKINYGKKLYLRGSVEISFCGKLHVNV